MGTRIDRQEHRAKEAGWMAPIPRSDTSMPWHWVPEGAWWWGVDTYQRRPPGYEAVCGVTVVEHPKAQRLDADESRPTCEACRQRTR